MFEVNNIVCTISNQPVTIFRDGGDGELVAKVGSKTFRTPGRDEDEIYTFANEVVMAVVGERRKFKGQANCSNSELYDFSCFLHRFGTLR